MVRIRTIQVRLSRDQYDRIKNDCAAKGFGSLSSYLRYLALYRDQALSKKILEIHDSVVSEKAQNRQGGTMSKDEAIKRCL
ncbi:hypothetical protein DESC_540019 [Desulfosarcina cetonica]|nr:hypothetical protein DESC_540019 [Desulfosarcina cetonica]